MIFFLIPATFCIATGGILYELYLGTMGSYLFGGTEKIFSLTTGVYMFSMGLGALFANSTRNSFILRLVQIEFCLILLHCAGPLVIWYAFLTGTMAGVVFWSILIVSGTLVGMEIPLLLGITRELETKAPTDGTRFNRILAADYFGALAASLCFGFYGLSRLGLMGSATLAALAECLGVAFLAMAGTWSEDSKPKQWRFALALSVVLIAGVAFLLTQSRAIQTHVENARAKDFGEGWRILLSEWSGIQQISLYERSGGDARPKEHRLYLDGQFQWSTGRDLLSYHQMLVNPAVRVFSDRSGTRPRRALILGGGDGFAADMLVRTHQLADVTIVDIDRRITELAREYSFWSERGGEILGDPAVHLVVADAFQFVRSHPSSNRYDLILFDLPIPRNAAVARLYSKFFFVELQKHLTQHGILSLMGAGNTFGTDAPGSLCILEETLHQAGFTTRREENDGYQHFLVASRAAPNESPSPLSSLVCTERSVNALLRPTLVR